MQAIQLKMSEARQTGNQLEAAKYAQELMLFMKEKNFNPVKSMLVPFAQVCSLNEYVIIVNLILGSFWLLRTQNNHTQ